MLQTVIRRMIANKWMFLCLIIGAVLLSGMVSIIPLYTPAILNNMLVRDLELYQKDTGKYPGTYYAKIELNLMKNKTALYDKYNDMMINEFTPAYGIDTNSWSNFINFEFVKAFNVNPLTEDEKKGYSSKVSTMNFLEDNVEIVSGSMYKAGISDKVIEAVVTERAVKEHKILLNSVYMIEGIRGNVTDEIYVKVVGIIKPKEGADLYWNNKIVSDYDDTFFIEYDTAVNDVLKTELIEITKSSWYYAFEYHQIDIDKIDSVINAYNYQDEFSSEKRYFLDISFPCINTLEEYYIKKNNLSLTLAVLIIPVLLMLCFYTFMIARLVINNDENEIAVLKSRGSTRLQIFKMYFIEGFIIAVFGALIGPLLGVFMCKLIGNANGFLEFVDRTALDIKLSPDVFIYSLAAGVIFIITMLIPAVHASRLTIIEYKKKNTGKKKIPFWKKSFIDVILFAASYYGLYNYEKTQSILKLTEEKATEFSIDPLLFFISSFFALSCGLLFLRIYPYIVRFIFFIGKRFFPPQIYASMIHVGRSKGLEQFLMLFLIFSLAVGIFDANAARTINENIEEKIKYSQGSDIVLQEFWDGMQNDMMSDMMMATSMGLEGDTMQLEKTVYNEPDFNKYLDFNTVEAAAKVFMSNSSTVRLEHEYASPGKIKLYGVVPDEFADTCWFRYDLLDQYHINQYLSILAKKPDGFLLSSSFKDDYDVELGDEITVSWGDQPSIDGIVCGFIDYWPAFNPNEKIDGKRRLLIIGNLEYIQFKTLLEPYNVWIKLKEGENDLTFNAELEDKKIEIMDIEYTNQMIIRNKQDPMLQGINGSLTLGFIVTMLVCLIGFLIYWILSIRQRVLQFGIFRAIGLSMGKIILMIICEQVLISIIAVFAGIVIGGLTSDLYVPLCQIIYSAGEQVPPFRVVASQKDYIKIYGVIGIMLVGGFAILSKFIASIKIDQAIKLGED